jgi:hypothetical protein
MSLKADHSQLPPAGQAGHKPPSGTRFLKHYVNYLEARRHQSSPADGARMRHSNAAKCSRALSFQLAGFVAEPIDAAGLHVMSEGQLLHEQVQQALVDAYRDNCEVEVVCFIPEADSAGHIDAVIWTSPPTCQCPDMCECTPHKVALELKTVGGFAFKSAIGERGPAEGPRHAAVVQGALNAYACNADELVIAYLATEAISKQAASRKGFGELARFMAEWKYDPEEFVPLAEEEIDRFDLALEMVDNGRLMDTYIPDPNIPDEALIVDPSAGRWEVRTDEGVQDAGTTWHCIYCPYQRACKAVNNPQPVNVDEAAREVEKVVPF